MAVIQVTEDNFDEVVMKSEKPVLLDFYADWCGPCKMMAPVVAKIAEEYEGTVKVGKCNVDENMQIAQKYAVASIPTFIVFKNGLPYSTFRGMMSAEELRKNVESVLK